MSSPVLETVWLWGSGSMTCPYLSWEHDSFSGSWVGEHPDHGLFPGPSSHGDMCLKGLVAVRGQLVGVGSLLPSRGP